MDPDSYFKATCTHCGGHIESPAHGEGLWIRCPHCNEKVQLVEESASSSSDVQGSVSTKSARSKVNSWIFLTAIFVLLAAAAYFAVRYLEMRRETMEQISTKAQTQQNHSTSAPVTPAAEPEPDLWKGLKPGPVTIEKSSKSRLVYAVVTVRNDTDKQRFGVKVAFDILDAQGEKLGTTGDYTQFIDAHKDWTFKAIVAFPKATTAKIASISDE